jgi:hypothetical protein
MKNLMALFLLLPAVVITGCEKDTDGLPAGAVQKAIVKGVVKTAAGSPIANAKVVIENTVFLATYVYATTNAKGEYSSAVPNGSWKVSVQIEKAVAGDLYKFDLHPDNADPFAGSEGAVRNFTWKLNGVKPGGGFYGSNVAVYPDPLAGIAEADIELILVPQTTLADGSTGSTITKRLTDIGGGEYGINDVPLAEYRLTARNTATNQPLQLRLRNTGNFQHAINALFKGGFTGNTTYQIVTEVK